MARNHPSRLPLLAREDAVLVVLQAQRRPSRMRLRHTLDRLRYTAQIHLEDKIRTN